MIKHLFRGIPVSGEFSVVRNFLRMATLRACSCQICFDFIHFLRLPCTKQEMSKSQLNANERIKILREINAGSLEAVKKFRAAHPELHWSNLRYDATGETILHVAARLGNLQAVEYLLRNYRPSGVDCRNNDNKTALHEAAQFAQHETVRLLIEWGADVNALKKADWTPLMLACTKVNANENSRSKRNYKTVEILLNNGAAVNYQNKDGWTALHLIAREGDPNILKLLHTHGLDTNSVTKNGRTALHIAALHGNYDLVSDLIKLKTDISRRDNCGNTALHEAILGGNLDLCRLLVKEGADVAARNKLDYTALHLASGQGDVGVVQYVVETLKIDVNVRTNSGLTPLHCAGKNRKVGAYAYLIERGADENAEDNFQRTPSYYKDIG